LYRDAPVCCPERDDRRIYWDIADELRGRQLIAVQPLGSLICSPSGAAGQAVRALAVTTATRSLALPEVPTLREVLPGYEANA
jgi:hypothetical protein